jgi:subfamily B ATP-binding cassette protein HlyB/CyaB
MLRFFGVPANPEPLKHQFTEPGKTFGETELLLAARHLGFKAGAVESDWQRLPHIALPAIAQQKDGRYVIIARADAEKVLCRISRAQAVIAARHFRSLERAAHS